MTYIVFATESPRVANSPSHADERAGFVGPKPNLLFRFRPLCLTNVVRKISSVELFGLAATVKIMFGLGLVCRGDSAPSGSQNSRQNVSMAVSVACRSAGRYLPSRLRWTSLS
jgi:hypothetical protein